MTRKIFWENPHQIFHNTIVTTVDGNDITLNQLSFLLFPEAKKAIAVPLAEFRLPLLEEKVLRLFTLLLTIMD